MMRIDDRKWKCFNFVDVFEIQKGFYNKKPETSETERIPFLGATANNNGVTGWCSLKAIENASRTGDDKNEPMSRKMFSGGCIAVTNNGSVGHAYYWPHEFTCSHDINPLFLKDRELNKHLAMFLIGAIEKQAVCFEYARKWRPARMVKSRIMLPVTGAGEPDYQFMEDYIRELMAEKKKQYRRYVKKRIAELCAVPDDQQVDWKSMIDSHEWEPFVVKDIADVYSGHDIYAQERIDGNTPLVTAVGINNGIGYFVGNDNDSRAEGSISVVRNGASVGKAFYHRYSALYGNDCRRIKLKNKDSEFASLFIAQVIRMQNKAFSYSRKLGTGRLENLKIMLPVTDDGKPDYDFMESFGRKMMINKYNQYLAFINNAEL